MSSNRREFLKQAGIGGGALLFGSGMANAVAGTGSEDKPIKAGAHQLPPLTYDYTALEPVIDEQTLRLHHDKHHAGYVKGLNNAELKLVEARQANDFGLIKHWERELAFHGSGHILHTIFWENLSPEGGGKPDDKLAKAIDAEFGSFDAFKAQMIASETDHRCHLTSVRIVFPTIDTERLPVGRRWQVGRQSQFRHEGVPFGGERTQRAVVARISRRRARGVGPGWRPLCDR